MQKQQSTLATPDQIEVERRALALLARPDVQAMRGRVASHWVAAIKPNVEHMARFQAEFDQAVFCGLMNAANHDSERPHIHAFGRLAHVLDGQHVPGTRSGHPNPDYIYRFMIVDEASRYEINGRIPEHGPAAAEISLLTREQVYLRNISLHELLVKEDGDFALVIDALPTNGRANHLPTSSGGYQLLVRDIISEASFQRPLELTVRRLGPPPQLPAPTLDEVAATCEAHMRKHVDDLIWVNNHLIAQAANYFEPPAVHTQGVYSVSQAYSAGRFQLADDEAIVFIVERSTAAYASVPVSDLWGGIGPFVDRQVSLGTDQARPGPDGRYAFVLAHRDPSVHNWIDTGGLHEGVVLVRWVGHDPSRAGAPPPGLETRLVKMSDLAEALPSGTPRIAPEARAQQIANRSRAYRILLS